MEGNSNKQYYPTWGLLVTGFSFSLFALLLSLVDDQNATLFFWIGGISFTLGLITGAVLLAIRKKKNNALNYRRRA